MADNQGRVIVKLDPDTISRIGHLKADGLTKNTTEFIRDAVAEKLGSMGANPDIDTLVRAYNTLTEEGRAWLMQCARIATGEDTVRAMKARAAQGEE